MAELEGPLAPNDDREHPETTINDYDSSSDSDAPSEAAILHQDDIELSQEAPDDDSEPPFPPFNIWSMPNARIPIEAYKEMTLACRFVPTDQWLTTRVDRTWTVSQVKHHMLTKLWGGRRYQLSFPRTSKPPVPSIPREPGDGVGITSISSSNYSSVVFAASIMGDSHPPFHHSNYALDNPSEPSLVQTTLPDAPDGPPPVVVGTPRLTKSLSSEDLHASHGYSPTSSTSRTRSQSTGGGRPPTLYSSESELGDLRREEAMERLYERIETSVRRKVHKAAKNYRLVSFSNGNVLDDNDPISAYRLKPFELLEIQSASHCIRLTRATYLEPYFETDTMVRVRGGAEKHGIEFIKRLRQLQREERARSEILRAMAAVGIDDKDKAGEWGTGLSAVTKQKNLEQRREEEKRRLLLEQARKQEERRRKRERKEQESEKWKVRKMIVEGHDLNIWRDPVHDTFPEQSWDLRRAIEVQIPRPPAEEPASSTQTAYAALAASSNLQSVSTRAPEKAKPAKSKVPDQVLEQPTLHIRFSIPIGSVYASLNPAAAAALHAARLKRAAKLNPGSSYLAESLASLGTASTRRIDSTDPYNQGYGFGTSTLEGAGTASLVLRLPNEKAREHLCRIIHRSAGRYPLITKQRRTLPFEPVQDLIPVPDPDPERKQTHGAPFPEWRARVLKKAIASGRSGFLASPAWNAAYNEVTGLYMPPPGLSASNDGGGYEGDDDDDCASLVSDTEWEGWRRELEMDMPPKPLSTIHSVSATSDATPRVGLSLAALKEEGSSLALASADEHVNVAEKASYSDGEEKYKSPRHSGQSTRARKSSLRAAKRVVVDGIAGKGLIIPHSSNAYASWTSFSSNSSINSSFHSHDDYRLGEGSDTNVGPKRPRLPPIVTGNSTSPRGSGNLSRAKSATVFSSRPNASVPAASISAPLSATVDNLDGSWAAPDPPRQLPYKYPSDGISPDELFAIGPDVALPGLGGGLGNPAMFPAFAGMGTTITTVSSGRAAMSSGAGGGSNGGSSRKSSLKKASLGSLRSSASWISRSFGTKSGEEKLRHERSLTFHHQSHSSSGSAGQDAVGGGNGEHLGTRRTPLPNAAPLARGASSASKR